MAEGLDLVGDISSTVEGSQNVVVGRGGAEGLVLGDGHSALHQTINKSDTNTKQAKGSTKKARKMKQAMVM